MSLNSLSSFCNLLRYEGIVNLYYRVLDREDKFKLCKIDSEDDVADMAAIRSQIGDVELYLVQEFYIRFLDSKLGKCNVSMGESSVSKEYCCYVDITFDDCTTFEDTIVSVEVIEEEDACKVDDDAELESIDVESLHDSDYDFSKDNDDVFLQEAIASVEKELIVDQK